MSNHPYMQFYPGDYLRDTRHLTTEQHGAYLLLLMTMWNHEARLPNDPSKLARIAGVSLRRWHLIAADIMPFFEIEGDALVQKRLVQDYQKAVSLSQKRSVSGKVGGDAKALKDKETALASATDLPQHRAHVPSPAPTVDSSDNSENIINVVPADAGIAVGGKYAFAAETIRLTDRDLKAWEKAFPHVSVEAELWAMDPWAGEQKAAGKNWFNAVSNALAKKERTMLARIHMAAIPQVVNRRLSPDPRI